MKRTKRAGSPKASAKKPSRFHALDYIEAVWDWGHPEWLVISVEAPIEEVVPLYAKVAKAKRTLGDLPLRLVTEKDDQREPLVAVVQPKECGWTSIIRLYGVPVGEPDWKEGKSVAKRLSAKLNTRALVFVGEDTSGAMGYFLYDSGELADEGGWASQHDPTDELFSDWQLYIAPCFPKRDRGVLKVLAPAAALDRIQRVDLVDIGPDL